MIAMRLIIATLLFTSVAASQAAKPSFDLARKGKPEATIVLAAQPTKAARFAAQELQDHLRRITGATLPIATDERPVAGRRILIGESRATAGLGLKAGDFKPQEYLIEFRPDTLVLLGRDASPSVPAFGGTADLPGFFEERGSLNATYDFLERYCDVRWYAPTPLGVVCPTSPTLAVSGRDIRRAPKMVYLWITPRTLYMPGPPQMVSAQEERIWKLRMRLGGQPFAVNHSFNGYYDRFLKSHPDWFAQGYPGGYKGKPPQLCYTNPDLIKQVVQDARDYFDGKGTRSGAQALGNVFGLVPMDNAFFCKCPRCQAQMNEAERNNPMLSRGEASDYVFGFVNQVAAEVRKTHPDKWVATLAYSVAAYHPVKVRLEPNVAVEICLLTRNWMFPDMEANGHKILTDWSRMEPDNPLYLWLYYCFPAYQARRGHFHCFPGFFAHRVVQQMKLYHEAGIRGLFLEHSSEFGQSYLMDQLEFYVTFKLADNPSLDGDKLIEEFFTRYYGAAAAPMKALYEAIEETYSNPKNYLVRDPQTGQSTWVALSTTSKQQTEQVAWGVLGTPERMAKFARLMAQARTAARTPAEKERVALFDEGIWKYMVEGRRQYENRSTK